MEEAEIEPASRSPRPRVHPPPYLGQESAVCCRRLLDQRLAEEHDDGVLVATALGAEIGEGLAGSIFQLRGVGSRSARSFPLDLAGRLSPARSQ